MPELNNSAVESLGRIPHFKSTTRQGQSLDERDQKFLVFHLAHLERTRMEAKQNIDKLNRLLEPENATCTNLLTEVKDDINRGAPDECINVMGSLVASLSRRGRLEDTLNDWRAIERLVVWRREQLLEALETHNARMQGFVQKFFSQAYTSDHPVQEYSGNESETLHDRPF